jgi:hypothetical protein
MKLYVGIGGSLGWSSCVRTHTTVFLLLRATADHLWQPALLLVHAVGRRLGIPVCFQGQTYTPLSRFGAPGCASQLVMWVREFRERVFQGTELRFASMDLRA